VRNAPSRRVLEKLGFRFQQTETHEHPKWTDADRFARYRIDREAWTATG
jgi:RimJ/RimL family protein N-acetyltransferase